MMQQEELFAPRRAPRQAAALEAIRGCLTAHRRGPTYRELAALLGGISREAARLLVAKLARRGLVTAGGFRGVRLS